MNSSYIYINWDMMRHVTVERTKGIHRDTVTICDLGNGVEVSMTPDVAKELAALMADVADEIEREAREEDA